MLFLHSIGSIVLCTVYHITDGDCRFRSWILTKTILAWVQVWFYGACGGLHNKGGGEKGAAKVEVSRLQISEIGISE